MSWTLRKVAEQSFLVDVARGTKYRVLAELKRWEKLTGDPSVDQIDKRMLRQFRADIIAAGYAPDTVIATLATIRGLLIEACDELDLIENVPRMGRHRLSKRHPEPVGATVAQVDAVFRYAHTADWPRLEVPAETFWNAWLPLVSWTGLRLSDSVFNLKWEHLRTEERCILFRASKTRRHNKRHVFPLPEWLWRLLEPMKSCGTDRVFPVPDTLTRFRNKLRDICKTAKVDELTPQNLRQFAVTQWTIADGRAGELVHGCGLPTVLRHYIGVLKVLESAEPDVVMPGTFRVKGGAL